MTLNEDECSQKWNLLSKKLSELDILISELATSHKNASITEAKNFDLAQLHLSAAFAMTELEKGLLLVLFGFHVLISFRLVKLRFTVNNLELKDHPIQIEEVALYFNFRAHSLTNFVYRIVF